MGSRNRLPGYSLGILIGWSKLSVPATWPASLVSVSIILGGSTTLSGQVLQVWFPGSVPIISLVGLCDLILFVPDSERE